jgi:hypothetical protein
LLFDGDRKLGRLVAEARTVTATISGANPIGCFMRRGVKGRAVAVELTQLVAGLAAVAAPTLGDRAGRVIAAQMKVSNTTQDNTRNGYILAGNVTNRLLPTAQIGVAGAPFREGDAFGLKSYPHNESPVIKTKIMDLEAEDLHNRTYTAWFFNMVLNAGITATYLPVVDSRMFTWIASRHFRGLMATFDMSVTGGAPGDTVKIGVRAQRAWGNLSVASSSEATITLTAAATQFTRRLFVTSEMDQLTTNGAVLTSTNHLSLRDPEYHISGSNPAALWTGVMTLEFIDVMDSEIAMPAALVSGAIGNTVLFDCHWLTLTDEEPAEATSSLPRVQLTDLPALLED